ncbi:MAG: hypothetical protein IIA72_09930 [Proteobacteria bacterium]|nr:hypothetical protein [Pseudomonadota bacterium]
MRDLEQTLLELAPSALHWIAVVGFATAGGAFGFGIVGWLVARTGVDKSEEFIHWLGFGAFLAAIPGAIALAAFIASEFYDYGYVRQAEDRLGSLVREYFPLALVPGVFLVAALIFCVVCALIDEIDDFTGGIRNWLRSKRERRAQALSRRSGAGEGFRRLAIIVGSVCGLVGVFFGLVAASKVSPVMVGAGLSVWFAATFYVTGWAVIRVIGWVVAGFFPSRKTERD